MYNFYVLEGSKFINYKPRTGHYLNAMMRLIEKINDVDAGNMGHLEFHKQYPDLFKKALYLQIKIISTGFDFHKSHVKEEIEQWFQLIEGVDDMVSCLAPGEFIQMFPIKKDYDGEKYECKDYFYSVEYLKELKMDEPIGKGRAAEFLMEYWNTDINRYMCAWMGIVNRMHQVHGGRDIFVEFAENQGVRLHTYHSDGCLLVDETGEQYEVKKPRNRLRKLFSVVQTSAEEED